jgi:hypothetical protein
MARTDGIGEFVPQGELLATEQKQQEIKEAIDSLSASGVLISENAFNSAVVVGTTSTLVIAANPNRKFLILVNDSDESIYVTLGSPAVLQEGIMVGSFGGALNIDTAMLYRGEVTAICESGGKRLTICEGY